MYDEDLKRKWDNEAAFAFREEKGKYENSREIAAEMKAYGMSVELIAKFTHLSPEEIEKLP